MRWCPLAFALVPEGLQKSLEVAEDILVNRITPPDDEAAYANRADRVLTQVVGALLRGQVPIPESQIADICALVPEPLRSVVALRWQGILRASEHAFDDALSLFEQALHEAKRLKTDPWIKRDIVLDLRNLEAKAAAMRGEMPLGHKLKWQRRLEAMSRWNFHPEIDHELSRVLESHMEDTFDVGTDSPLTVRIGDALPAALGRLSKAMVVSVLMGSYTFLHLLRTLMAYTLYHYFTRSHSAVLLLSSLRLLIAERKTAAVRRIMNAEWDTLYAHVVDNPLTFVASAGICGDAPEDRVMRCVLLEALSAYVSAADLPRVQEFLLDCVKGPFSMQEQLDVRRTALRTLRRVVNRLDTSRLVTEVLEADNENLLVRDEVLKVLSEVDWERVPERIARRAVSHLFSWRRNVLQKPVLYVALAKIREAHGPLFSEIDRSLYREWQATESPTLVLYFSETTDALNQEDLTLMESRLLRVISDDNRQVAKGSPIKLGGYSMVGLLARLVSRTVNPDWKALVSVFKEVLTNPHQGTSCKYDCLTAVIHLALTHPSAKRELGAPLNRIIQGGISQVLTAQDDLLFGRGENQKLELRARELSAILGEVDLDAAIPKCVEYGMVPLPEVREASMSLIRAILEWDRGHSAIQLRPYLFSKTFDNWHRVRATALMLLSKASAGDREWERISIDRMKVLLNDSSAHVRGSIIQICAERLASSEFRPDYMSMVQTAERDPHYALQAQARAILHDRAR